MSSKHQEYLEEAVKKLEELSSDKEVVAIAESRAKYLSDYNSNMHGAHEKGLKEGIEKGIEKGIYRNQVHNILSFLEYNPVNENVNKKIKSYIKSEPCIEELEKLMKALFTHNLNEVISIINLK